MIQELCKKHVPLIIELSRHGQGDSDRHLMTLFGIALASKGKIYLELGIRDGATTLPLLLAAYANEGRLISVDINPTSFVPPPDLVKNWQFIQSDSIEFLKKWNQPIDVIFIDDWHTYPHVKKEISIISRLITPSSIILLHDLMYGGFEPRYHTNPALHKGEWAHGGPYRAVADLDPEKWEWSTLPWASGLTILRNKAPVFSENRLKVWLKRFLKNISPSLERKAVSFYHKKNNE